MNWIPFSEDFDWGTASSGPQSEGYGTKKHDSIWDYWYKQDPERFHNNIGPGITCDSFNRFKEDASLMKQLKLKSFRTSIQWTRLIKDFETGEVDPDGVAYYNEYIDALIEAGVEPVMNLFHFDTPMALQEAYQGFESMHVADLYVKFATQAFKHFGDRVKRWITFNEPIAHTKGAFLYDFIYPNKKSFALFAKASYHILMAHAKSVEAYRSLNLGGEIGIVVDLLPPLPRSEDPRDQYAAYFTDLITNRIFMDPCVLGAYHQDYLDLLVKHDSLFDYTKEEFDIIKNNTVDFIGINYYQPARVQSSPYVWDENEAFMPEYYSVPYLMANRRMNPYRGWEIYPKSIYDIAMRVKNDYNNIKWFISENGMGVEGEEKYKDEQGMIQDHYRIAFIKEHLVWLQKAIEQGSNCCGYHLWTFVDNWSWTNSYKNRYGYVSLDLKTRNRTIKASGYFIKQVIEANGFEADLTDDQIYLSSKK